MKWNWQLDDWINFFYQTELVDHYEQEFIDLSGQALGALRHIEKDGNERQNKVVLRVLQEGVNGFKRGLSASNYRSITQAPSTTVTRD